MQAVRSVASGGKFYPLPPNEENTGLYDLPLHILEFGTTENHNKCEIGKFRIPRRPWDENLLSMVAIEANAGQLLGENKNYTHKLT